MSLLYFKDIRLIRRFSGWAKTQRTIQKPKANLMFKSVCARKRKVEAPALEMSSHTSFVWLKARKQ